METKHGFENDFCNIFILISVHKSQIRKLTYHCTLANKTYGK